MMSLLRLSENGATGHTAEAGILQPYAQWHAVTSWYKILVYRKTKQKTGTSTDLDEFFLLPGLAE